MSRVDVTTSIRIERPLAEVAAYTGDPSNAPEWYVNIRSVEWITDPPMQLGSQMRFVAHFLGRRLEYTYKIIEWTPNERLVMCTEQGPFPMETHYTWKALDSNHTRMSIRNRGEPTGFSAWLSPLMVPMMRRTNQKDLARAKSLLENTAQ